MEVLINIKKNDANGRVYPKIEWEIPAESRTIKWFDAVLWKLYRVKKENKNHFEGKSKSLKITRIRAKYDCWRIAYVYLMEVFVD
jgi:hypothetical protein